MRDTIAVDDQVRNLTDLACRVSKEDLTRGDRAGPGTGAEGHPVRTASDSALQTSADVTVMVKP